MNIRRTSSRRVAEEIANARATSQGNRNALEVQATTNNHVPVNHPAMMGGEVREALSQMGQSITTQAQAIITQANSEVAPQKNQHASTMASRLRDFTRMNPPMYFGSNVDEDPQDFLDEVSKIMFYMGMSTTYKAELASYKVKDVSQTWYNH